MTSFVNKAVLDAVEAKKADRFERKQYTPDEIKVATDIALKLGPVEAGTRTGIKSGTIHGWKKYFNEHQQQYYVPQQRGGKPMLSPAQEKAVLVAADAIRAKGERLDAPTLSAAATGMYERTQGSLSLKVNGGTRVFSHSWARRLLDKGGFGVFQATTDRTIPAIEIVAAAEGFFKAVRDTKSTPKNTYNMDEFFCLLNGTTRKWTWHRKSAKSTVPLRDVRVGFTMSATTCADGEVIALQMIWHGKTDAVHAKVPEHPRIWQDHQPTSHFQNAETFERWFKKFLPIAVARRGGEDCPITLILDAAGQHSTESVKALMEQYNVVVVCIPPKMTHVFQPADQYVICNLKKYAKNAWFLYVQALFRTFDFADAIKEMHSTSAEISRVKKHSFFAEALDKIGSSSVIASWAMSGILRECFMINVVHISGKRIGQPIVPVIDEMKIMAEKGGLFVPEEEIDVDEHPDEKLGEEPAEMVMAVASNDEDDIPVPQVVLPVAPVHGPLPAPVPKETKKAKDVREKAEKAAASVVRHAQTYRPITQFFPVLPK